MEPVRQLAESSDAAQGPAGIPFPERPTRLGTAPTAGRLVSLDMFRGLTIFGMLLVNDQGAWRYIYPPLEHAAWDGWTMADLIFPFFLFIVGVAVTLALGGKLEHGTPRSRMMAHAVRRAAVLFALGVFLNGFPFFHVSTLRIPGVLQRTGICYLVAAGIFLFASVRTQAIVAASLIAAYTAAMALIPVPAGYLQHVVADSTAPGVADPSLYVAQNANIAAYVDNTLMPGHLWSQTKTWDPEGLLSTCTATATVLFGMVVGHVFRRTRSARDRLWQLLVGGTCAIVAGEVMSWWVPINKSLWTGSFVVFTAGMAMLFLAACYWLVDVRGYSRIARPWVIYGVNPITVYVLSSVAARAMELMREPVLLADGTQTSVSLWTYSYQRYFVPWAGPANGSLAFAVAFALMMLVPAWLLYRQRIFIKV